LIDKQAEIERIEEALSKIQFPLNFSDRVYNLRRTYLKIAGECGSAINEE
jgi:hypothetical protein